MRIMRFELALVAACCLALAAPRAASGADAPDRTALEKQLQAAREQLDRSAREVAELSRQLYGGAEEEVMRFVQGRPPGSMIGINIGGGAVREEGVEVVGVSPGGPAELAGLKAGDIVTAVDGQALKRSGERGPNAQLIEFMRGVEPGRVLKVDYLRDGQRRSASVTAAQAAPPMMRVLRERLAGPLAEGLALPGLEGLLGPERGFRPLELVPLTPKLGQYFGTDRGLLVVRAGESPGLPLEEGDVLLTIDGRTPESPGHAFRILRSYQPGEKVQLGVMRQRKPLKLEATLPAADAVGEGRSHRRPPAPPVPPPPASGPA
jgi:membrane-associated protease RseP (regulator of RpoE activity)